MHSFQKGVLRIKDACICRIGDERFPTIRSPILGSRGIEDFSPFWHFKRMCSVEIPHRRKCCIWVLVKIASLVLETCIIALLMKRHPTLESLTGILVATTFEDFWRHLGGGMRRTTY